VSGDGDLFLGLFLRLPLSGDGEGRFLEFFLGAIVSRDRFRPCVGQ